MPSKSSSEMRSLAAEHAERRMFHLRGLCSACRSHRRRVCSTCASRVRSRSPAASFLRFLSSWRRWLRLGLMDLARIRELLREVEDDTELADQQRREVEEATEALLVAIAGAHVQRVVRLPMAWVVRPTRRGASSPPHAAATSRARAPETTATHHTRSRATRHRTLPRTRDRSAPRARRAALPRTPRPARLARPRQRR